MCSHSVPIKFPKFPSSFPKTFKEDGNIKTKNQGCSGWGGIELVEMVSLVIIIIALNNRNFGICPSQTKRSIGMLVCRNLSQFLIPWMFKCMKLVFNIKQNHVLLVCVEGCNITCIPIC